MKNRITSTGCSERCRNRIQFTTEDLQPVVAYFRGKAEPELKVVRQNQIFYENMVVHKIDKYIYIYTRAFLTNAMNTYENYIVCVRFFP